MSDPVNERQHFAHLIKEARALVKKYDEQLGGWLFDRDGYIADALKKASEVENSCAPYTSASEALAFWIQKAKEQENAVTGPEFTEGLMHWVKIDPEDPTTLPRHDQAVLIRRIPDNWGTSHMLADCSVHRTWRWQAALFVRGRTAEEVEKTNYVRGADQSGNNLVPYRWEQFGPSTIFGQDVSHWAAITDPLKGETA